IAQYNRDLLVALAGCRRVASIEVLPRWATDASTLPDRIRQRGPRSGRLRYAMNALLVAGWHRPNVVFCGHLHMAPLALAIARLARARLVVQAHGIEAWPTPRRLTRRTVEAADLVLCVSRHTRGMVVGWAEIAPERIIVVPDTVADVFAPADAAALRKAW